MLAAMLPTAGARAAPSMDKSPILGCNITVVMPHRKEVCQNAKFGFMKDTRDQQA